MPHAEDQNLGAQDVLQNNVRKTVERPIAKVESLERSSLGILYQRVKGGFKFACKIDAETGRS